MPLLHLLILALIQGVTEFLPVSSSGHLALLPNLTGLDDQGLALDVAVHVGTLFAVILYFRADVLLALSGVPRMLSGRIDSEGAFLSFLLIIATIPVVLVGLVLHVTGWADALRSLAVIGWAMLIFGVVLYWADRTGAHRLESRDWSISDAIWMGIAQAFALIPGTSRSGITITAARKLGYAREDAARLAMLMSIPTIIASGTLLMGEAAAEADAALMRDAAIAAGFAFVAAFAALVLMMRLLRSLSFTPYVIYRCLLGIVLLIMAYS